MSDQPDRALLESKTRDDLVAMAAALGLEIAPRARKATIIDDILKGPTGGHESDSDNPSNRDSGHRASEEAARDATQAASGETSTEDNNSGESPRDEEQSRQERDENEPGVAEPGNRRRRRRGRDRDDNWQGEPVECEGILDLRDEGYGFLRTQGALPSNDDVYVAAKQVRSHGLRKGDIVKGASRPAARNEKNPALLRIDEINGAEPDESSERPLFEDLTAVHPREPLTLEGNGTENLTARVVDLIAPIGKGQRGLVVSPPECGKTSTIRELAVAIETTHPDLHVIVLLIDERPEEVTDIAAVVEGEVLASTFDRPADEHIQVAELTLERAKRMVEGGLDVVILLDGLSRLARAYNLAAPGNGRVLVEGVDAAALYPPKRFFGAARAIEEGGSLTIIATAAVETGWRLDEMILESLQGTANSVVRLDRRAADRRVYPAIDAVASCTRELHRLNGEERAFKAQALADTLVAIEEADENQQGSALDWVLERIAATSSNEEILSRLPVPGHSASS
ncbi:MAG TPA: transcription termination factor Rho [Acidimicrobiales bacterium]|nr:transcription termination factor Rho [Acidimicrobiales bacterium]